MLKPRQFIPVLIIAAGIWAYHNSFQGPFIYDDLDSIPENPHIRHLWSIGEAMGSPPHCAVDARPVVSLTLALNYALDGLNVRGYHAFNLMVHLLSGMVLFGILRRTFASEKLRDRLGSTAVWLAAAIALIWEVHPLQTECVTYIIQRTQLLMGLFLLLTVYCVLRSAQSSQPWVWHLAAVVSCALGMGSKQDMVGAPLIVLLYDRVFLASSFRELWRRRMSLYVGLAATWLMLGVLVAKGSHTTMWFRGAGLTSWDYLKTEPGVILYYLRLCFWPRSLVIDYYNWPIAYSLKDDLVSGTVVLGLLGASVWAFRRQPWLGFLSAWFFLILGPTSSFLPSAGELAAERRMYLPLAAVITIMAAGAFVLGKRLLNRRLRPVLGCVATGSVATLFAFLTVQRNQDYKSALAIWQDSVQKRPDDPRAHTNFGVALIQLGRLQKAIKHYEQALLLNPLYPQAYNNLGAALIKEGMVHEAIGHYEQALRLNSEFAEAHNNLGNALDKLDKPEEAIAHYEQALRINPDLADAHYNWGVALVQLDRLHEAIGQYKQAIRLKPDFAEAHNNLGTALMRLGRLQEAIGHYEQALRINPQYAEAQNNLALALVQLGRLPEAIDHWQQALRIKPDYAGAHYKLARALEQAGRIQEATAQYKLALQISPNDAEAHYSLARSLARLGSVPEAIGQYEQAVRLKPDFSDAYNDLAWLLATRAPAQGGNAVRAVALAQRACELAENRRAGYLDTLAAAYAAAGQFSEAIATAEKAIELARTAGPAKSVGGFEARLELYRSGRAYIQP